MNAMSTTASAGPSADALPGPGQILPRRSGFFGKLFRLAAVLVLVAAVLTLMGVGAMSDWVDSGLHVVIGGDTWIGESMPWEHGVGASFALFLVVLIALCVVPIALALALGAVAFGVSAVLLLVLVVVACALSPLLVPVLLVFWLVRRG